MLSTWTPDQVIPAAKLNEPVNLLNAMADDGLSYASMFQRTHLQKLAIASPQDGYYLYNAASDTPQIYINGRWYEFVLARADYDLSGTVTNTLSGLPIAGVAVTANGNQTTATDASGHYSLTNIPKGAAVTVAGTLTGYNTYASTVNLSSANATKDFTMARRTVSGTVTSSAGGAVVGATVQIASPARSATTDASGNYSLIDVPDGSYTLTATLTGYDNYSHAISVSGDTPYSFTMTVQPATVTGTVTSDTTGLAVIGASVVVDGQPAVTTNSSGVYTRTGVQRLSGRAVSATYSPYFSAYSGTVNATTDPTTKNFSMTAIARPSLDFTLIPWHTHNGVDNVYTAMKITVTQTVRAESISIANFAGGPVMNPVVGQIYNASNTLIASTAAFSVPSGAVGTAALTSPVTLTPGDYYITAYRSSNTGSIYDARLQFHSGYTANLNHHAAITVDRSYRWGSPSGWTVATGSIVGISVNVKM